MEGALSEDALGHTGGGPDSSKGFDGGELAITLAEEDPAERIYLTVIDGVEYGPFSQNQLRRQVMDGKLESINTLIHRNLDREFMAADHPKLRPIFMRLAKEREALDAQVALEEEKRRVQRAHALATMKWVLLALVVFGGAGFFLWFRARGA